MAAGVAAHRTREDLVPGAERCSAALGIDLGTRFQACGEWLVIGSGHRGGGIEIEQKFDAVALLRAGQTLDQLEQRLCERLLRALGGCLDQMPAFVDLHRDPLAGAVLLAQLAPEAGPGIAPGFDGEFVPTECRQGETAAVAIVAERLHHRAVPGRGTERAPEQIH